MAMHTNNLPYLFMFEKKNDFHFPDGMRKGNY